MIIIKGSAILFINFIVHIYNFNKISNFKHRIDYFFIYPNKLDFFIYLIYAPFFSPLSLVFDFANDRFCLDFLFQRCRFRPDSDKFIFKIARYLLYIVVHLKILLIQTRNE